MSFKEKMRAHKTFTTIIIMVVAALAIYAIFPKNSYSLEVNGFDEKWQMGSDKIDKVETAVNSYPLIDFQFNGANYSTRTDGDFLPVDAKYVKFEVLAANLNGGKVFQKAFPENNFVIYALATPYKVFYTAKEIAPRIGFYSSKIEEQGNGKFIVVYSPDAFLGVLLWISAVAVLLAVWWLAFIAKC